MALSKITNTGINNITVDSSGNVGIGTTSPARRLTLHNSGATTSHIQMTNATTGEAGANGVLFGVNGSGEVELWNYEATAMRFAIGGSEKMRIDSSGRVGIKQTNPDSESLVDLGSGENSGYTRKLLVTNTGNSRAGLGALSNIFRVFYADDQAVQFGTVSRDGNFTFSEKMRLESSGNLALNGSVRDSSRFTINGNVSNPNLQSWQNTTSGVTHFWFRNPNGIVGSIVTSGSSTAYNTSSDYRLKTGVTYDWDATSRLKQLKPARFAWIADGDDAVPVDGFLAHEVQDIVPEAISGTKDAMRDEEYEVTPAVLDDDGNEVTPAAMGTRSVPDYQGIDQSKLVPLLVKTIQELEARIVALETA